MGLETVAAFDNAVANAEVPKESAILHSMGDLSLTASGTLAATPLSELLVYALERQLSGTIVLEAPTGTKHALTLEEGQLTRLQVNHDSVRIGALLVRSGVVDVETLQRAEARQAPPLFGQRLVAEGVDRVAVEHALVQQVALQLEYLSQLKAETAFGYYDSVDLLGEWGGCPNVDMLAAIWASVRSAPISSRILQAYAGMSAVCLRLHQSSRISRFAFRAKERAVLDVLRVQPQSLEQLRATGLAPDSLLQRLVFALVITGHLDVGKVPVGVGGAASPAAAVVASRLSRSAIAAVRPAAASKPGETAEPRSRESKLVAPPSTRDAMATAQFLVREEIEAKVSALDSMSAYEVLELSPDCADSEVPQAFARLAKRWHPDRLSPPCADLKDAVTRVFARITDARAVLSNPEERKRYDESVGDSEANEEQRQVEMILQAAADFQKAEIMVRKRDMRRAEALALRAKQGDPDQAEYGALHAWILSGKAGVTSDQVAECVEQLRKAALKQPGNVRIRYYLATALKKSGDTGGALREFRFVAERDPSNLDAVREIRLSTMRKPELERRASGGLFGRLFKR